MYWVVLIVDLTGIQLHSPAGRSLLLAGSLFTIPLAFGLYYAVKPEQSVVAASALVCRFLEATLGLISTVAGYASVLGQLSGTSLGNIFFRIAQWGDSTNFAAFIFTIGSTLFFYLLVTSGYIPRILLWWGLCSSVLACSRAQRTFPPGVPVNDNVCVGSDATCRDLNRSLGC